MEQLLHYVWKHKLFPLRELRTSDGMIVEVIDPGLQNRDAGPDFFNAKVRIGGTLWVGNVEIHRKASDWYLHGHDRDSRYDSVILHVAEVIDAEVRNAGGRPVTQLRLEIPASVSTHYEQLFATDGYPPCHEVVPGLSRLTVHAWMAALQTERLEQKTAAIRQRVEQCSGSWEDAYFMTLARNYGFGINGDVFEQWAQHVPLSAVGHHRDDLFQIEAVFMGQAGLLETEAVPDYYRAEAQREGYFTKLRKEYDYLSRKFALTPMDFRLWRFLRLRPQNFPHIRISQLATLYHQRKTGLSQLVACETVEQLKELLSSNVTPYWETHYTFGSTSSKSEKRLSYGSLNLLMINTAIPMLFAYGRHRSEEALCERAFNLLEQLPPENNHIIRMWQQVGLVVQNAGDTQALIQLKKEYCDKKDCLRCRIGYEYLKRR